MLNCKQITTPVISAFPGTGKTHLSRNAGIVISDSDSSSYSWLSKGIRNPDFPGNYIAHIKHEADKSGYVLVSSHAEVREALASADIPFTLVYPSIALKDEYISRYAERGSPPGFIDLIALKWDEWINELRLQQGCSHVVLTAGQYLSDLFKLNPEVIP